MAGCANPGPPKPPSLHLARIPNDLTAVRRGPETVLRFTPPKLTTDGEPLDRDSHVEICRAEGSGACTTVIREPLSQTAEFHDKLPPGLVSGGPEELRYQVRITNAHARAAGWSKPVRIAAGQAPETIQGVHAELRAEGLLLRWTPSSIPFDEIRIERTEPDRPQKKQSKLQDQEQARQQVLLRVSATYGDPGGAVDPTAEAGKRYLYHLERLRTVRIAGEETVLGSPIVDLDTGVLRDVTPPATPQGLVALASDTGIALSWEPGTEPDIAGYVVYRAEGAAETRLNATPVTAPQFTDASAVKGIRYRYRVSAVDKAGNESNKSDAVTEEMR